MASRHTRRKRAAAKRLALAEYEAQAQRASERQALIRENMRRVKPTIEDRAWRHVRSSVDKLADAMPRARGGGFAAHLEKPVKQVDKPRGMNYRQRNEYLPSASWPVVE